MRRIPWPWPKFGESIKGRCLRRAQLTDPSLQNEYAPGRTLAFSVVSGDWEIYRWKGEGISSDGSHIALA